MIGREILLLCECSDKASSFLSSIQMCETHNVGPTARVELAPVPINDCNPGHARLGAEAGVRAGSCPPLPNRRGPPLAGDEHCSKLRSCRGPVALVRNGWAGCSKLRSQAEERLTEEAPCPLPCAPRATTVSSWGALRVQSVYGVSRPPLPFI